MRQNHQFKITPLMIDMKCEVPLTAYNSCGSRWTPSPLLGTVWPSPPSPTPPHTYREVCIRLCKILQKDKNTILIRFLIIRVQGGFSIVRQRRRRYRIDKGTQASVRGIGAAALWRRRAGHDVWGRQGWSVWLCPKALGILVGYDLLAAREKFLAKEIPFEAFG